MRYADPEAQAEIDRLNAKIARVEALAAAYEATADSLPKQHTVGQAHSALEWREQARRLRSVLDDRKEFQP